MSEEKRKRGRPRKHPPGRIYASVRFSPDRYQAIKTAAEVAGRSVSEEIEYRVEKLAAYNEVLAAFGLKPAVK